MFKILNLFYRCSGNYLVLDTIRSLVDIISNVLGVSFVWDLKNFYLGYKVLYDIVTLTVYINYGSGIMKNVYPSFLYFDNFLNIFYFYIAV